jgi:hypothetical protein
MHPMHMVSMQMWCYSFSRIIRMIYCVGGCPHRWYGGAHCGHQCCDADNNAPVSVHDGFWIYRVPFIWCSIVVLCAICWCLLVNNINTKLCLLFWRLESEVMWINLLFDLDRRIQDGCEGKIWPWPPFGKNWYFRGFEWFSTNPTVCPNPSHSIPPLSKQNIQMRFKV